MIAPCFPHTQDEKNKTHTSGEKGFHHFVLTIITVLGCSGDEENHGHKLKKVSDHLATREHDHPSLTGPLTA